MEGGKSVSYARSEISKKNPYWIPKHRYFELKHFCLQYPDWKNEYAALLGVTSLSSLNFSKSRLKNTADRTSDSAIRRLYFSDRMRMVEQSAIDADPDIFEYLLKGVTAGCSYTYLKTYCDIPCSKDFYYDRYRRFFWLLDKMRE